jgi:hypothetical protein
MHRGGGGLFPGIRHNAMPHIGGRHDGGRHHR